MQGNKKTVSRRGFLGAAGTATLAGSVSALPAAAAESTGADRKIRIGVVGGGFGASFQWHLDPQCIVEAVSDLRTDRRDHLQRVYGCEKPYESVAVPGTSGVRVPMRYTPAGRAAKARASGPMTTPVR